MPAHEASDVVASPSHNETAFRIRGSRRQPVLHHPATMKPLSYPELYRDSNPPNGSRGPRPPRRAIHVRQYDKGTSNENNAEATFQISLRSIAKDSAFVASEMGRSLPFAVCTFLPRQKRAAIQKLRPASVRQEGESIRAELIRRQLCQLPSRIHRSNQTGSAVCRS